MAARSTTASARAVTAAVLHTTCGAIRIALFPLWVPHTVANFVGLAEGTADYTLPNAQGESSGPFYDGTLFHRVISGFVIQAGDPTGTGRGGPGYRIAEEFHPRLQFDRPYLVAMANAGPNTTGSQFFVTLAAAPYMNFQYSVFGEVADLESQDAVNAIAQVPTGRGDRPVRPVRIEHVVIERHPDPEAATRKLAPEEPPKRHTLRWRRPREDPGEGPRTP